MYIHSRFMCVCIYIHSIYWLYPFIYTVYIYFTYIFNFSNLLIYKARQQLEDSLQNQVCRGS